MKVAYISTLDRGGPLSHLRDLAPAVAALGVQVSVICANEAVASSFRAQDVEAHAVPVRDKRDVRGAASFWPLLREADVVHTQDRRAGLFGRLEGRLRGARVVHTMHGMPEEIAPRVGRDVAPGKGDASRARLFWLLHGYLRIEGLLASLGRVVVPSQAMAAFLTAHGLPAKRLAVIPLGVRARPTSERRGDDRFVIGAAANLEHWKGLDVLLEACTRTHHPLRLEIFGDGSLRNALENIATTSKLAVGFNGFVDDLASRLADLDLLVHPSRAENLPMSILEAMAVGLPVVATRVGGVPELVVDGETGILVEPDDPDALALAIDGLATDPERRRRLGRAGRDRVEEHFSIEHSARSTLELYEELCVSST